MERERNPIARDLRSPKYSQRRVKSKKAYTRKEKHGTRSHQETNAEDIQEATQFDDRYAANDGNIEVS